MTRTAADEWKPALKPGLIVRDAGDKQLIIDPESRRWAILHAGTALMARACDGSSTIAQITGRILPEGGAILEEPLRRIMRELQLRGFVTTKSGQKPQASSQCCDGPVSLHLEITNRCNLKCTHCYVSAGKRLANELTLGEMQRAIDEFDEACIDHARAVIAITGGEARLRRECPDVLRYARQKGYATRLFTDAVHFPLDLATSIAEMGVSVQVSLDGVDQESNDAIRGAGTFAKIVSGIDTLIEAGLRRDMILFTTLSRQTIDSALGLLDFAESRAIPYLHFSQMNPQGRAAPIWESLAPTTEQWIRFGERLLARRPSRTTVIKGNAFGGLDMSSDVLFPKMMCEIPSAMRIDCLGNIYPCQLFVEPEHRVGNIREQSLAAVLAGEKMAAAKAFCANRTNLIPKCRTCPWEAVCGGGCPAHAYSEFGTVNHEDSLCDVRIHWFEAFSASLIDDRPLGTPVPVCVE